MNHLTAKLAIIVLTLEPGVSMAHKDAGIHLHSEYVSFTVITIVVSLFSFARYRKTLNKYSNVKR